jgi:hypothetical protein
MQSRLFTRLSCFAVFAFCLNPGICCYANTYVSTNSEVNARPEGLYVGTVGSCSITVCMVRSELDDSEFYEDKVGKTMILSMLPDDPHRRLQSEYSHPRFPDDFDARSDVWWQIDWHGKKISGVRHIPGGPDQHIALTRQRAECNPGYEDKRLDRAAVVSREETNDGITFKITTHPVSKLTGTLIGSGLDAGATARINSALVNSLREMNKDWVTCTEYEGTLLPLFVTSRWLTIEEKDSRYCGGIHAFYESGIFSFDTNTGERIDFDDWIGSEYFTSGIFNDDLWKFIVADMRGREDFDECIQREQEFHDDKSPRSYDLFSPWMGLDAFNFRLDIDAPVALQCAGDYAVPFDAMRTFIKKEYLEKYDEFVAAAKAAKAAGARMLD